MPATIDATPGSPTANSFATLAEINAYFESRLPLDPPWDPTEAIAIPRILTAARMLTTAFSGLKRLITPKSGEPYYLVGMRWKGVPTVADQAMDFPRTGLLDRLGRAVDPLTVPIEIKQAHAELAGQLSLSDRTLENEIAAQGITAIKAGPVSVNFNSDSGAFTRAALVLPDHVLALIPPSWYEPETMEKGPDLRRSNRPRIANVIVPRRIGSW
jgi:hypothetical protein